MNPDTARFQDYGGKPLFCRECCNTARAQKRPGESVLVRISCECGAYLQHTFPAGWGDAEAGSALDVNGTYDFWKKVLPLFTMNKAETIEEALADLERQKLERSKARQKPVDLGDGLVGIELPPALGIKLLAALVASVIAQDPDAICPGCGKKVSEHDEEGHDAPDA